jgi:hypothetical protein
VRIRDYFSKPKRVREQKILGNTVPSHISVQSSFGCVRARSTLRTLELSSRWAHGKISGYSIHAELPAALELSSRWAHGKIFRYSIHAELPAALELSSRWAHGKISGYSIHAELPAALELSSRWAHGKMSGYSIHAELPAALEPDYCVLNTFRILADENLAVISLLLDQHSFEQYPRSLEL